MNDLPLEIIGVVNNSFSVELKESSECYVLLDKFCQGNYFKEKAETFNWSVCTLLRKAAKDDLEMSKIGWAFFLSSWSKINDEDQRKILNKCIFQEMRLVVEGKNWGYAGVILNEMKNQSFSLSSRETKIGAESWSHILAGLAYRQSPEHVFLEWLSARQKCENPQLLTNNLSVFKEDLEVLSQASPKALKSFCAAANKFYQTNDWLWEASYDLLKKEADNTVYKRLSFPWLQAWRKLLSKQGFELPREDENCFQERIFLLSLLEVYEYKPKPELLPLPIAFDMYVKTLCLSYKKNNTHRSPFEKEKGISLLELLSLYDKAEVDELWANKKGHYADFLKEMLEATSEQWDNSLFNNRLRSAKVLKEMTEAFPEDKNLFVSQKNIQKCGEKGIFYMSGGFHLVEKLMELGVVLNKEVFEPNKKEANPNDKVKQMMIGKWLELELKRTVKAAPVQEKVKKKNDFRF